MHTPSPPPMRWNRTEPDGRWYSTKSQPPSAAPARATLRMIAISVTASPWRAVFTTVVPTG